MTDRHVPRLCPGCQAPMAGQEASCWRCGAQWASEDVPPTRLRAIAGGLHAYPVAEPARVQTPNDDDRWANEGVGSEATPPLLRAVAARR